MVSAAAAPGLREHLGEGGFVFTVCAAYTPLILCVCEN